MSRDEVLQEARRLVGDAGEVRDYQCSCHPGGERFLIRWKDSRIPVCYSLGELKAEVT